MGRRSKAVKLVGGVRGGLALLDDDERRRVIEAGERDIDDGVGFFSRPGSARGWWSRTSTSSGTVSGPGSAGICRGRVTSVMREPGIRGVRRGGTPVTARLARGAGGGPGLVGRGFETGRRTRRTGLGLQDTGTDRNRVLREPSGASRPTIRAEQKTGHINVPDGTFAPPLVRLCGPVISACRRTAPGRSRRRTHGSQPDARPSATASGRSSSG